MLCVAPCLARVSETFHLEDNAWDATQIVVVLETKHGGQFQVVETWKGYLNPGDIILVPEMTAFQKKSFRRVSVVGKNDFESTGQTLRTRRLVLFLKEPLPESALARGHGDNQKMSNTKYFVPAAEDGGMRVSFAWLSSSEVFAFWQMYFPGSSALISLRESEKELSESVKGVLREQQRFAEVMAISNKTDRARRLIPFLTSEYRRAADGAWEELPKCGRDGLPVLREVLNDPAHLPFHAHFVETMADIAGKEVGPELTVRLQSELAFWRARATSLKKDWWGDSNVPDVKNLQDHYMVVLRVVEALKKISYRASIPIIKELLEFWSSSPNLDESTYSGGIVKECGQILREWGATQP
jgi:hypothetical protein